MNEYWCPYCHDVMEAKYEKGHEQSCSSSARILQIIIENDLVEAGFSV